MISCKYSMYTLYSAYLSKNQHCSQYNHGTGPNKSRTFVSFSPSTKYPINSVHFNQHW